MATHQHGEGVQCGDRIGFVTRAVSYRTNTVNLMADDPATVTNPFSDRSPTTLSDCPGHTLNRTTLGVILTGYKSPAIAVPLPFTAPGLVCSEPIIIRSSLAPTRSAQGERRTVSELVNRGWQHRSQRWWGTITGMLTWIDGPDTDGRHDGGGRTVLMMAGQIDVMPILPMVTDGAAS